ncbi:MAG: hypothetical protein LBS93_05105, partial [Synergistaceae bacterium]|nr:hypothetical protein [Synergistaceae bacterium]
MGKILCVLSLTLFAAVGLSTAPHFGGAAVVFAAPAAQPTVMRDLEKEIKLEEQKLQQMQKQISEVDNKKKVAAEQEKKVIKDLNDLSSKLSKAEQLLKITVLKRNQVAGKITEILAQIEATSKGIGDAKRLLSGRIVAMYKYGGMAEFNLLMSATGAQEALSTQFMLSKIAKQDMALIDELYAQKQILDNAHADLVKQKAELEVRDNELKKQQGSLRKNTQDRNKLLQQVRKDKALFQAQQAELQKASKELQQKVQQLLT